MYYPSTYLPKNLIVDSNIKSLNKEQQPIEIYKRTRNLIQEESRYRWLVKSLRFRLNDYNKYHSELMLEIEDYREIEQTTTTFIYNILNLEFEDSESDSEDDSESDEDDEEENYTDDDEEENYNDLEDDYMDEEENEDIDLFNEIRCFDLLN